jgi:aryl-alcohol dehydrogenase-like predicted oxidoreductase
MIERTNQWMVLAAEFGVEVPALAIAFAWLPKAVSKVAIGTNLPEHVDQLERSLAAANSIPNAVWQTAVQRGLLPAHFKLV